MTASWGWLGTGVLVGFIVVLLHRMRAWRTNHPVSSLMLWHLVQSELQQERRRRRWITHLLMLLQILILLLLSFALSNPRIEKPLSPVTIGIMMDTSASMLLKEGDESRWDVAVKEIRRFLSEGQAGQYALWTTTAPHIHVVTRSKEELLKILAEITPVPQANDWDEVLTSFRAYHDALRPEHTLVALIVTDGSTDVPSTDPVPALLADDRLYVIPIGTPVENVGITQVHHRPVADDLWEQQIAVSVGNYGGRERSVGLRMKSSFVDDESIQPATFRQEQYTLLMAPGEEKTFIFQHRFEPGEQLTIELQEPDDFPWDDQVLLHARPPRPTRVLFVGGIDPFVLAALEAHDDVEVLGPIQSGLEAEEMALADFVIFHEQPVPKEFVGNALHIAESSLEAVETPAGSLWWEEDHPLFRFVDWHGVRIGRRGNVIQLPESRVIVEGPGGPYVTVTEQPKRRIISVGFPFDSSDMPFSISFPIFMSHVLDWARPERKDVITKRHGLTNADVSDLRPRIFSRLFPADDRLFLREATLASIHDRFEADGPSDTIHTETDTSFTRTLWTVVAAVAFFLLLMEGRLYEGPVRRSAADKKPLPLSTHHRGDAG